MNIRIAIADDHPMVINGIKDMLSGFHHIHLSSTYNNAAQLMEGLKSELPDVLLLDIQMPDRPGDELVPVILKLYPDLHILVLTNFDNTIYVNNLLLNGALGYLLKNTNQETLLCAIETVHRGVEFLNPDMKEKLEIYRARNKKATATKFALTPREKQILKLITAGKSNQQIAEQLSLSLRTIENYRLNLSLKLEVKNTAGLVRKGIELGVDLDSDK